MYERNPVRTRALLVTGRSNIQVGDIYTFTRMEIYYLGFMGIYISVISELH